jgi:hypothetical protein
VNSIHATTQRALDRAGQLPHALILHLILYLFDTKQPYDSRTPHDSYLWSVHAIRAVAAHASSTISRATIDILPGRAIAGLSPSPVHSSVAASQRADSSYPTFNASRHVLACTANVMARGVRF